MQASDLEEPIRIIGTEPYDDLKYGGVFVAIIEGEGLIMPARYLSLWSFSRATREARGEEITLVSNPISPAFNIPLTDYVYLSAPPLTWKTLQSIIISNERLLGPLIQGVELLTDLSASGALDDLGDGVIELTNSDIERSGNSWSDEGVETPIPYPSGEPSPFYYIKFPDLPVDSAVALCTSLETHAVGYPLRLIQVTLLDPTSLEDNEESQLSSEVEAYIYNRPITGKEAWILPPRKLAPRKVGATPALSFLDLWGRKRGSLGDRTFIIGTAIGTLSRRNLISAYGESRENLVATVEAANEGSPMTGWIEQWRGYGYFDIITLSGGTYSGLYDIIEPPAEFVVEGDEKLLATEFEKLVRLLGRRVAKTDEDKKIVTLSSGEIGTMRIGSRYDTFRSAFPEYRAYYGSEGLVQTRSADHVYTLSIVYPTVELGEPVNLDSIQFGEYAINSRDPDIMERHAQDLQLGLMELVGALTGSYANLGSGDIRIASGLHKKSRFVTLTQAPEWFKALALEE